MLTMEQIYRIKNMRKFEGKSLRKIAEITGHDFATVKKYTEKDNFNINIIKKSCRKSKLSPYKDIVARWLKDVLKSPHKQRHTAKRIHDRLKEEYPDEFNASERSVRKFVASLRNELGIVSEGFLRFMVHYGFRSNFCNPRSGHEKGSVENKVGYHRRNLFVPDSNS